MVESGRSKALTLRCSPFISSNSMRRSVSKHQADDGTPAKSTPSFPTLHMSPRPFYFSKFVPPLNALKLESVRMLGKEAGSLILIEGDRYKPHPLSPPSYFGGQQAGCHPVGWFLSQGGFGVNRTMEVSFVE